VRSIVYAIVMLAVSTAASAQHIPRDPPPNWAIPPLISGPQSGAVPTIGTIPPLGLPSIGLPLPPMGLPPAPLFGRPQPPLGAPGVVGGRHHGNRRPTYSTYPAYPVYPTYLGWPPVAFVTSGEMLPGPAPAADAVAAAESTVPARTPKGSLVLQVQPARALVFVDGYFVGIVDDFDGTPGALVLDAGAHVIELDDPAYDHAQFDVRIDSQKSIVYRRELSPVSAALEPAPLNSTPSPMYSIPGCYLGNVAPKDAGLPSSCDPARAIRLR
jgi:hypothetical protein